MQVHITAGPDAGRQVPLTPGRHLIGRARSCSISIADPATEPHHAVLTIGEGAVTLTHLAARTALLVDRVEHHDGPVAPGAVVELGDTRLELGRRAEAGGDPNDRARTTAARARAEYLARAGGAWVIELGRGDLDLDPDLGRDPADPAPGTSFTDEAATARLTRQRDVPILADLAARPRYLVAVRGEQATRVVDALMARALAARARAGPSSAARAVGRGWHGAAGTEAAVVFVELTPGQPVPAGVDGLLDLGARWRATWEPDLSCPSTGPIRLHVAGGRVGARVGEQVARPGTERGGRVVGIPDPAHAE